MDSEQARQTADEIFDIGVDVPQLHFELPESSSHAVQELDEAAGAGLPKDAVHV